MAKDKQKKPFYKKVWFWLVVVILICIGFGAVGSKSDNGGTKVSHKEATSKKTEKVTYYKIGDSVKVKDVIYTLKSVEVVAERNEFEDSQPKHVIRVVYHVKNDSDKDIPIGADLDAYGPDNNKLKSYPVSDITIGSVAAGKEMDVVDGFGTDKLGDIELQFAPLVSTAKAAKFKVNVKDTTTNETPTSSSTSTTAQTTTPQQQQQPTQQASVQQPTTQQNQNSNNEIDSAQSAVNAARAKYGDDNGSVKWNYMIDGTTGQPIRNADGSYFVKGTNGQTMSGTQYSVNVHPDGSITSN